MTRSTDALGSEIDARRRSVNGPESERWLENRPPSGWLPRIDLRELWGYRELGFYLGVRDLKLRYKQTVLGVIWALLQPLAVTAVFTLVLGRLVGVPSDGLPYVVFAYSGMVAWAFFSATVTGAAESLVDHRALVTNVYFPRLVMPLATVLPALVDLAVSLSILIVLLAAYGINPGLATVSAPIWIVALAGASLAIGIWLSALNVLYRDVRYAVGFLLQLLFFVSPVVFPSSLFEGEWRALYSLNPLVGALDGFRWSIAGGAAPPREDIVSLFSGGIMLVTGVAYFQKAQGRLVDRI